MGQKTRSLKDKIVTANLLFFSLVLTILFVLFYSWWFSSEKKNAAADLETIALTKADQIHSVLWNMDRTALQLANDPYFSSELFAALSQTHDQVNIFSKDRVLNSTVIEKLTPFVLNRNVVSRICLFNAYNDFISVGQSLEFRKTVNYYKSPLVSDVRDRFAQGEYRVMVPPRDDPFYYESRMTKQSRIISVFREIIDISNSAFQSAGYVEVQQETAFFESMFADLEGSIYYSVMNDSGQIHLGNFDENSGVLSPRAVVSRVPIPEFGLVLELRSSNDYLTRMSSILAIVLFLTLLLMVFGILSTENFVVRRLTTPLDELQQMVDNINVHSLDFNFKTDSEYDQVQHLNLAFTEMLGNLRQSVDELVEARTDELRSHLFALQAQINPHFIHNTMAVISSIADEHDVHEIEEICTKLSSMIRYSSQYNNTGTALTNELDHGRNYLELMGIRYQDRMSFTINGYEGSDEIQVPKFVLQPLIENCFSHGLKQVQPPWFIGISVDVSDFKWSVSIQDNGAGFNDAILLDVQELWNSISLNQTQDLLKSLEIGGMGLKNVFARLFLMYREKMIFNLENRDGGARITIGGIR
ncbi:MAG: histidine kinase [Spirochaetales bacterium]|nr:histidine kinase [Spirochaetales bacterium]